MEVIELGELEPYDDSRSIGMEEARALIRGQRGRAALEVVRRWANPRRGWHVPGTNSVLILPAERLAGRWRTMVSWVEAFERKRRELCRPARPPSPKVISEKRRAASMQRANHRLNRAGIGVPNQE